MSSIHDQISERFYAWERRGRGWQVFPEPVFPEPPFRSFNGYHQPNCPPVDDGRRPTMLSSFMERLSRSLSTEAIAQPDVPEPEEEPEPETLIREPLVELRTSLPAKLDINAEAFAQFLRNLSLCHEPVAFEVLGTAARVSVQFAAHPSDAPLLRRQLQAHFSEATFLPCEGALEAAWDSCAGDEMLAVEFGLEREFMFPLASGKLDPFVGIVGALAELQEGELGLFQVIFEPVSEEWAESIVDSVTHADGKPLFVNQPELTSAAENKVTRPLYAAVVRIAAKGETFERVIEIARDLAGSLRVFAHPKGNALIPLANDDYPFDEHIEDVIRRQSRRSGMVLNSDELVGFVHLPSSSVRSPTLARDTGKTKAAPALAKNPDGILLGDNLHAGQSVPVRLTTDHRVRHTHIIGASGTGKSTLLFNLIRQDIENGEGVAVFDPHGDLVNKVLGIIPPHRIKDVVLVDPTDPDYAIGFNILSAHSELEKTLLASDLISVFQRLSTSWGDQMHSVLQNAILAFLESSRRGTLADLRRFLVEPDFRKDFLTSVSDTNVLYYWHKGFPHLGGNKSIGPILTRLEMFLARKPIMHMVSQTENRLDFGQMMDTGKIFLTKLPEGLLGKENSYLLGTLLISKFHQLAMSRQAQDISARRDFWIYADEFQNYITPSMADILQGARKYRIGLTLAHHELRQLQRDAEVASAVMAHPCTRIVFRVGDDDAKKLGEGFSFFESRDVQKLGIGEAIVRIERSDCDFNLTVPLPHHTDEAQTRGRRQEVVAASRAAYGTPRAEVETMLRQAWESETAKPEAARKKPPEKLAVPESRLAAVPAAAPIELEKVNPFEAPKVTDSEKEMDAAIGVKPPASRTSPLPRPEGKGGAQHQAIQQRIKQAAEALGFRSTIEKQLGNTKEGVDVLLVRGDEVIACEISISTTIDHEVGNVAKCLKAGCSKVAVICLDDRRLEAIAAAVSSSLGSEAAKRVVYLQPDQFIADLQHIPPPPPLEEAAVTRRGYKVKRTVPNLTQEERQKKEMNAVRALTNAVKGK
jgi:hypothetical protein